MGIKTVPDMTGITHLIFVAVCLQGCGVDVIHCVMLDEHPVHAVVIGIPYHASHFLFLAVVISFVVATESSFEYILIDIDGSVLAIRLGNIDGNDVHIAETHNLHILVRQQIHIHFATVDGIPESLE